MTKPAFTYLVLLSIIFFTGSLLFVPRFFFTSHSLLFHWFSPPEINSNSTTISCDRTDKNSDICYMKGDIRTHSPSSTIFLLSDETAHHPATSETIRPYTRKWDAAIKDRIDVLQLKMINAGPEKPICDLQHDVPALVFSAGGYTGNTFHDFNDGLIPLYITSHRFNRKVALVALGFHGWWYRKYREILSQLSDYPPIDFFNDTRTHCFPEIVVGLRFQGTLAIDADNKTITDFHYLLDAAYEHKNTNVNKMNKNNKKPKLVIVSRQSTRAIENEGQVLKLGKHIGFEVEVISPSDITPMTAIYRSLSTCDVMIGVHGAALTHFLFMRTGSVFIQIVPHGLELEARSCYEEPAVKMGLVYQEYKVLLRESSLSRNYEEDDEVLKEPERVKGRGWEVIKEVYLAQNVTIDLNRFEERLRLAFQYITSKSKLLQA